MKDKVIGTLAAIVLMLALVFPVAMPAQQQSGGGQTSGGQTASQQQSGGGQTASGQNAPTGKAQGQGRERHPEIREAIRQLQLAKQTLQKDAARDFDGHRANAVQQIDQAIAQLRQAQQSDKQ